MVLYHASTMYHLLCCIVHKLAFNNNEESELLLLEYIKPDNQRALFLKRLKEFNFFTRVRYVPEQKFKLKKGTALYENSSNKQIEGVIKNICKAFKSWFNEDIKKYNKIYVASDQHSCGIYLIYNHIPYEYMEDASGMLSEQKRYLSITKSNNLTNYVINEYLGGAGRNKYVTKKLCDLEHQKKNFFDEKAYDFSINKTLNYIIPDYIPILLDFFDEKVIKVDNDKKICLFMSQDLNTLKIKDIDLQELTVTLLVDYICPDYMLVIKPHPKDRWQNYKRIFPNSIILSRGVPSELLPFSIKANIDIALTASSTSIRGVSEFANHAYSFTNDIETNLSNIDDMYIACEVLKYLNIKDGVKVDNINTTQICNFLENSNIIQGDNRVLINGGVKKLDYINFNNYDLVICLSLGNVLNYTPSWNIENLYLICANYQPDCNSLVDKKDVYIIVYCKNDYLKERLNKLKFIKILKYSKAKINVTSKKFNKEISEKLSSKLDCNLQWEIEKYE